MIPSRDGVCALSADLVQVVDDGTGCRRALTAHDRGLVVADRRVAGERHGRDQVGVEEDVEAVCEREALARGHERLRFDGFVAVAGVDGRRREAGLVPNTAPRPSSPRGRSPRSRSLLPSAAPWATSSRPRRTHARHPRRRRRRGHRRNAGRSRARRHTRLGGLGAFRPRACRRRSDRPRRRPGTGDAAPATAIAAVTTIGYLGSFSGPPALGAFAQVTDLSTSLIALVVVSAILGVLARPALWRLGNA